MLWLLCLTGPFQGLLDALEEVGSSSWRRPPTCLGKQQEQPGWDYTPSKAAWLAVTLSPENLMQSHQPHAGRVANLRVCLLPQPVWFSQAVQITASNPLLVVEVVRKRGRKVVLKKSFKIYVFFLSAENFFLWSKLWNIFFIWFFEGQTSVEGKKTTMKAVRPGSWFLWKRKKKK